MSKLASLAYLNVSLIPVEKACISAADHGFLYGAGLFETIKVLNGKPVFLEDHLERLLHGTRMLEIATPRQQSLVDGTNSCIQANKIKTGYLRLTLSRGVGDHSWDPEKCEKPTLFIAAHRGLPYSRQQYQQGFKVVIASFPRNQHSPLTNVKSLNYSENIMAKLEARKKQADECLFLNTSGQIAECSMSNIFLIKDNRLKTPAADCGLLQGIVRRQLLECAQFVELEAVETHLYPQDLFSADEVFITNSLLGLMPLVSLDGRRLGSNIPGSFTLKLSEILAEKEKPASTY